MIVPGYLGECDRNPATCTSDEEGISLPERWRRLTGNQEHPPRERLSYCRRYGEVFWLYVWAALYLYAAASHWISLVKRGKSASKEAETGLSREKSECCWPLGL